MVVVGRELSASASEISVRRASQAGIKALAGRSFKARNKGRGVAVGSRREGDERLNVGRGSRADAHGRGDDGSGNGDGRARDARVVGGDLRGLRERNGDRAVDTQVRGRAAGLERGAPGSRRRGDARARSKRCVAERGRAAAGDDALRGGGSGADRAVERRRRGPSGDEGDGARRGLGDDRGNGAGLDLLSKQLRLNVGRLGAFATRNSRAMRPSGREARGARARGACWDEVVERGRDLR